MFIGLDIILKKIKATEMVDIVGTINDMRYQHMNMINSFVSMSYEVIQLSSNMYY